MKTFIHFTESFNYNENNDQYSPPEYPEWNTHAFPTPVPSQQLRILESQYLPLQHLFFMVKRLKHDTVSKKIRIFAIRYALAQTNRPGNVSNYCKYIK